MTFKETEEEMATTIPDENTQAIAALTTSVALLQESLSAEVTARQTGDTSLKRTKADAEETSAALLALASDKADKAVTLEGYGITDAKIANGTITLGADSITPLTSHQSLDAYVNAASYDSNAKKILLKHDVTTVAEIDATAFIKDGMVSSVAISNGKLVITFNTDAGLEPIEIPLTDIFNPANYYDKTATNTLLSGKADKVANATSGNLAAIDSNGNLVDSGNMVAGAFTAGSFIGGESGQVGFQLDSTSEWVELYVYDGGGGKILKFPLREGTLAVQDDIAPTFDETNTYYKGALVFHDGLYQCVNPNGHTGAWVAANFAEATVEDVLAALRTALSGKADASSLAPVATSGNYDDLRGKPGNVSAFANDAGYLTSHQQLRYAMPESVALTPSGDAATLVCADRAVTNATIASGFSTINLTFPAAVSGYVRDFYLRITVAAGESAPALSLPQGITIENAGGAVPEIADGEASAAATTLVWFSETAPGVFTAKSETVKAVV